MDNLSLSSKLNNIGEKVSHYFYGKAFPVQIALISVLCYVLNLPLVSFIIISLLASFIFVFYKNLAPIFPMLFMVLLAFNGYEYFNGVTLYITLIPAGVAFVARFFLHPIKWERPTLLVYALIGVTVAYLLAGLGGGDYNPGFGIAYLISLGPVMLVIYLLFAYNIPSKKGFCIKKYLCFNLVVAGFAMIAEIIYLRFIVNDYASPWTELGWANINACAGFLLLSIASCYYLMIKSKFITPYIFCVIGLYVGLLISGSDASFALSLCFAPFLIVYTYRNVYKTKRTIFSISVTTVVIGILITVIVFLSKYDLTRIINFLQLDANDSGRNEIYQKAIELFRENPFFGWGFKYTPDGIELSPVRLYNFHSTLLHVLATMGIFGVVAYAFYFFVRFYILMRKYTPFTTIMLIAFVMFESYAMVDTGEFNAIPLMSAVTVMITVAEWANKKENCPTVFPLSSDKYRGSF